VSFERLRCTTCTKWFARDTSGRKRPVCERCEPPIPRRKFEPAKVGDMFGRRRVDRLVPRDATSNERVWVRCTVCGHEASAYVFNLRKSKACRYCPRAKEIA
jgi:hypothetical protein